MVYKLEAPVTTQNTKYIKFLGRFVTRPSFQHARVVALIVVIRPSREFKSVAWASVVRANMDNAGVQDRCTECRRYSVNLTASVITNTSLEATAAS